ncbi:hypothetical protein BL254_23445 [Protofrankia sp. BMG5.30]|uniref:Type II CBASS E2 protein domain-containing protein n=1 Tax=Protofrankia coriariae TaxID=1562887 RepID=A0ABR5EYZ1_9ACTN|nr:hypothetical protein FrCorBMG51_23230 [Protofrankia coriariae]ONH31100.1 hypothetical protein BL254_23445 [Protofrankia sp. BMG5.30]
MTRRAPWRAPAWFARPAPRILFLRRLADCGIQIREVRVPFRRYRGGFAFAIRLDVADLPVQTITIVFSLACPESPHVYTDGPSDSPHRYSDGALCMWYPADPGERRWNRSDGAPALLGHIVAHLLREEWWRRTGEWPGCEVIHA